MTGYTSHREVRGGNRTDLHCFPTYLGEAENLQRIEDKTGCMVHYAIREAGYRASQPFSRVGIATYLWEERENLLRVRDHLVTHPLDDEGDDSEYEKLRGWEEGKEGERESETALDMRKSVQNLSLSLIPLLIKEMRVIQRTAWTNRNT